MCRFAAQPVRFMETAHAIRTADIAHKMYAFAFMLFGGSKG
jgi:hypothetical protein